MFKQLITVCGVFSLGLMVGFMFFSTQGSNFVWAQSAGEDSESLVTPEGSEFEGAERMENKLNDLTQREEEMTDQFVEDIDSLLEPKEEPTYEKVDEVLTKFEQLKVDLRVAYEESKQEFAEELRSSEEGGSEFVISEYNSEVEKRYVDRVSKLDIALQLALGADAKFEESYAVLKRLKEINDNLKKFAKKLHNTRVGIEQLNAKLPCSCMSCI